MNVLKLFLKRLGTSKVLWKQLVTNLFAVVWLILAATGQVDAATQDATLAVVLQVAGYVYGIWIFVYNLYSGGNNPSSKIGY